MSRLEPTKWTPPRVEFMKLCLAVGVTPAELARHFGVTDTRMRQVIKSQGLNPAKMRPTPEKVGEWLRDPNVDLKFLRGK